MSHRICVEWQIPRSAIPAELLDTLEAPRTQRVARAKGRPPPGSRKSNLQPSGPKGDTGASSGVTTACAGVVPDGIPSGNQRLEDSKDSTGYHGVGGDTTPFAASLLHGSAAPGGDVALLDVRQVAVRLGVCRDTVYELCKRGALRHIRVLNAIRVHPEALAAFVARRRR